MQSFSGAYVLVLGSCKGFNSYLQISLYSKVGGLWALGQVIDVSVRQDMDKRHREDTFSVWLSLYMSDLWREKKDKM